MDHRYAEILRIYSASGENSSELYTTDPDDVDYMYMLRKLLSNASRDNNNESDVVPLLAGLHPYPGGNATVAFVFARLLDRSVTPAVVVAGLIGNLVALIVFSQRSMQRRSSNVYLPARTTCSGCTGGDKLPQRLPGCDLRGRRRFSRVRHAVVDCSRVDRRVPVERRVSDADLRHARHQFPRRLVRDRVHRRTLHRRSLSSAADVAMYAGQGSAGRRRPGPVCRRRLQLLGVDVRRDGALARRREDLRASASLRGGHDGHARGRHRYDAASAVPPHHASQRSHSRHRVSAQPCPTGDGRPRSAASSVP